VRGINWDGIFRPTSIAFHEDAIRCRAARGQVRNEVLACNSKSSARRGRSRRIFNIETHTRFRSDAFLDMEVFCRKFSRMCAVRTYSSSSRLSSYPANGQSDGTSCHAGCLRRVRRGRISRRDSPISEYRASGPENRAPNAEFQPSLVANLMHPRGCRPGCWTLGPPCRPRFRASLTIPGRHLFGGPLFSEDILMTRRGGELVVVSRPMSAVLSAHEASPKRLLTPIFSDH